MFNYKSHTFKEILRVYVSSLLEAIRIFLICLITVSGLSITSSFLKRITLYPKSDSLPYVPGLSEFVQQSMVVAIQFNNQFRFKTSEICYIIINDLLPSELIS